MSAEYIPNTVPRDVSELTKYNEMKLCDDKGETYKKQVVQKKNSLKVPMFQKCTFFGNVTINVNK